MNHMIDVHHHFVPPFYAKALEEKGGDPSGWPTPVWSINASEDFMANLSIGTTIFSVTAPGACILQGAESASLARQCNEFTAALRDKNPSKFGFFVSLPDLLDKEAALAELRYGLDTLRGDGVVLFTRYGHDNHYLGHPDLRYIWDELDARGVVVFIHPTHPADTNLVSPFMPQPIIDYTFETTRTAVDLIISDTIKTHRNCKIILSHAGGTLPYIVYRPAVVMPFVNSPLIKTAEEFLEEASSFYFDLALSAAGPTIEMLTKFAKPGHVLYGSDFPYAPKEAIEWFATSLKQQKFSKQGAYALARGNAEELFPRLKR